nr:hypothetical protein [Methylobacterium iners]
MVAKERDDPGPEVGTLLEAMLALQRLEHRILDQIVRPVEIGVDGSGEAAQGGKHREQSSPERKGVAPALRGHAIFERCDKGDEPLWQALIDGGRVMGPQGGSEMVAKGAAL